VEVAEGTPTTTPTRTFTATPTRTATTTLTRTATTTATATLSPTPTDAYEPNNSYGQAFPVTSGQVVQGRILPSGDLDFFAIPVSQPNTLISATLSDLPANYDLYLDLPNQTPAASSTNSGTQNERIDYVAGGTTGTYYVVVVAPGGTSSAAPYTLRVDLNAVPPGDNTLQGSIQDQRVATPEAVYQLALQVEFRAANPPGAAQPAQVSGGPVLFAFATTTTAQGAFTVSGIPAGTYAVRVKHPQAISTEQQNLTFGGGTTVTQDFGLQRTGDANQMNQVSAADFTALKQTFSQPTACATQTPIPNPCADFDANGMVGPNDFSLLKQNFGLQGPLPT
jgi:hypothetical protein